MKKPAWVIEKERAKRAASAETVWLFGLHAVRDALMNPARERLRLVVTKNAADRLAEAIAEAGMSPRSPIRASSRCRSIRARCTRGRRWRSSRLTGASSGTCARPVRTRRVLCFLTG